MTFDPFDARGAFVPPEPLQVEAQTDDPAAKPRRSILHGVLIIAAIGAGFIMGGILL